MSHYRTYILILQAADQGGSSRSVVVAPPTRPAGAGRVTGCTSFWLGLPQLSSPISTVVIRGDSALLGYPILAGRWFRGPGGVFDGPGGKSPMATPRSRRRAGIRLTPIDFTQLLEPCGETLLWEDGR
jgi:hypothetical protein